MCVCVCVCGVCVCVCMYVCTYVRTYAGLHVYVAWWSTYCVNMYVSMKHGNLEGLFFVCKHVSEPLLQVISANRVDRLTNSFERLIICFIWFCNVTTTLQYITAVITSLFRRPTSCFAFRFNSGIARRVLLLRVFEVHITSSRQTAGYKAESFVSLINHHVISTYEVVYVQLHAFWSPLILQAEWLIKTSRSELFKNWNPP
jgi:hypothetical protein